MQIQFDLLSCNHCLILAFTLGRRSATDCIVADSTNSFKPITVPCSSQASYLCEAWSPPCPDGYTWIARAGNASCFKINSGGYKAASFYWQSITTAEKLCMEDGTRLSSPDTLPGYSAVRNWLGFCLPFMETSSDIVIPSWLGYRKINQSLAGISSIPNSSVISTWYSNSSNLLPVASYITINKNVYYPFECTFQHPDSRAGYNCLNAENTDKRVVCEYRHCTTLSGKGLPSL